MSIKPTIAFCIAGDKGRGHAARAIAVAEQLKGRYQVVFFGNGEGKEMLESRGLGNVHEIPYLRMILDRNGSVDWLRTAWAASKFALQLFQHVNTVRSLFLQYDPALVVCDFEPLSCRAARGLGIPLVHLNSQMKFTYTAPTRFPLALKIYWYATRFFIWLYLPRGERSIVTSFHPETFRQADGCLAISPIVRSDYQQVAPRDDGFLMVYCKPETEERMIELLRNIGFPVRVYGLHRSDKLDNIQFCGRDSQRFAHDLSRCHAVLGSAGVQMPGEARSLGKPLLSLPDAGQFEQYCNAQLIELAGMGEAHRWETVTRDEIRDFFETAEPYEPIQPEGAVEAAREIHRIATLHAFRAERQEELENEAPLALPG